MSRRSSGSQKGIAAFSLFVVAALFAALAFAIYQQAVRGVEGRVIEAGLIEAGERPTIYFTMVNTGTEPANYTYVVKYNSTGGLVLDEAPILNVPPGRSFYYALALLRPDQGTLEVVLEIYRNTKNSGQPPIFRQTWIIKAASTP